MPRSYWLDLFTGKTWAEFQRAGASVSGFRETQWKQASRVRPGDVLLCYLTGVSRFVGSLEVITEAYLDQTQTIWSEEVFPARFGVRSIIALSPETAVPMTELVDRFSWAPKLTHPHMWTGYVRRSLNRLEPSDGELVMGALEEAARTPISRSVDPRKLARRPRGTPSPIGPVVVPDPEPRPDESEAELVELKRESTAHTEVQWLLLKLGSDMGLDVWAARNDRGREHAGRRFDDLPRFRHELPRQFDPVTSRTVELIDVLWLQKNSIEAAFEIESTTSIYSGLLRMADLIALQPNLKIPLFIVAPDERRDRVIAEVNRPVFRRLDPAMSEVCQFLSFSALRAGIAQVTPLVHRVDPAIIRDWAEPIGVEEP